ncbi:MAG: RHS repeat-associated core domain-containing protein [Spirochaetota bacterium]
MLKSGNLGDVVYVNANYTLRNSDIVSKHVFAGNTRIVSKMSSVQTTGTATTVKDIGAFYYHGDHLGSSSVITDSIGKFYEHIEYFPYGEDWVDEKATSTSESVAYKFTAKEYDAETGYTNFGARYYDMKLCTWISVDKAFPKYIPSANDFDTEHDYYWYLQQDASKKLPGIGGVFNSSNLNVYHYAGLNPVKYVDPDGNAISEAANRQYKNAHILAKQIRENFPDSTIMGIVADFVEPSPSDFVPGPAVLESVGAKATGSILSKAKNFFSKLFNKEATQVTKNKTEKIAGESKALWEKALKNYKAPKYKTTETRKGSEIILDVKEINKIPERGELFNSFGEKIESDYSKNAFPIKVEGTGSFTVPQYNPKKK